MTITCLIGVVVAESLACASAETIEAPTRTTSAAYFSRFRRSAEVLKWSVVIVFSVFSVTFVIAALAVLDKFLTRTPINLSAYGDLHRSGGFRREVQPRRQHWFLNEKSGFPSRTPAFCSASRGRRRLGEKEYRAPSVTPGVALRPRTQGGSIP